MVHALPFTLLCLVFLNAPSSLALPGSRLGGLTSLVEGMRHSSPVALQKRGSINYNPDGTPFLWLPQDEYSGKTFFDRWNFFDHPDPTNGHVNYIDKQAAFDRGLVSYQKDGTVLMKSDDFTHLERGKFRDSIRIESQTSYNGGLFILDLNRAPWGCATWPAFWTVGGNWPYNGEIDIIEGVHDNQHNQVAWHTAPGCGLNTTSGFTGSVSSSGGKPYTDCNAFINSNSGCSITEWSRASYGPYFDSQGGGIFVMKWDENDISIWSFYRAAIPKDITAGAPNPSEWGSPSARLHSTQCEIGKFFANHSVVFDITFCGDWAGNSYATSGCPGTCEDRLMDPANFQNASWSINSLKVYKKQVVALGAAQISAANTTAVSWKIQAWVSMLFALAVLCTVS